jgi:hypothetical protein
MQKHTPAGHHTDLTFSRKILRYRQLPWLMEQYPSIPVFALYNFLGGFVSIGLMAAFAVLLHSPFIFPSLGPTAFHYFSRQTAPTASPRNAIIGHFIGIVAGYFSLVVTGLTTAGPAIANGVTWPRVIAAALSLGLTAGLMMFIVCLTCTRRGNNTYYLSWHTYTDLATGNSHDRHHFADSPGYSHQSPLWHAFPALEPIDYIHQKIL